MKKHQEWKKSGSEQLRWKDWWNRRRSGEDKRWGGGRPLDKYGKKQQKEWLDNILPGLNPFTAGNKEEKHR